MKKQIKRKCREVIAIW